MDGSSTRPRAKTAPGRDFLKNVQAMLCLLLAGAVGCNAMIGQMVETAVERQRNAGHTEWLDDGALHVVLCGTGSPLPDPTSAAACTAVVASGRVWVVDVGPGSQEVAQLIGVPRAALGGVLLTHFHSDHIGELGEWAMQSWVAGRKEAFHVFGPPGVDTLVMTHLVPSTPGRLRRRLFTRGLEEGDVEVVLEKDGMHFRLPADSEAIEQETLGS